MADPNEVWNRGRTGSGRGLERGLCPLPRKIFKILSKSHAFWRKIFPCFKMHPVNRGGGRPPPSLNPPLVKFIHLFSNSCVTYRNIRVIGGRPQGSARYLELRQFGRRVQKYGPYRRRRTPVDRRRRVVLIVTVSSILILMGRAGVQSLLGRR